jgi:multicomponent K+:H+ antiporter subunit F
MTALYAALLCMLGIGAAALALRMACIPGLFDKALAAHTLAGYGVAFIVLLGLYERTAFYIDVALVFALLGFISAAAFLRYVERRIGTGDHE